MPFPNPPSKIVAFNSGSVAAHDIGRQFDEHRRGFGEVINFLRSVVREDGHMVNGSIGIEQLDPALQDKLAQRALDAMRDFLDNVRATTKQAVVSAGEVRAMHTEIAHLKEQILATAAAMRSANEEVQKRLECINTLASATPQIVTPTVPTGVLGPQYSNFYATDEAGSGPLAQDYAQVSIEWAEHMPDTIPPNILAVNAITGEHWSSRWWAMRAGNAFGMLAWWYQGAWPSPGPPSTPNTPTGQPLPPGSMYFDTDLGVMLVWNGSSWVPVTQGPGKATTSSLYYLASAGQTVFPLSVLDRNSHTFAFNQAAPEGLHAHVNGVRLEPGFDYTIDIVGSSVTFLRGLTLNTIVTFDILTPVAQLTPSGTVNTVLLNQIVPDGSKTVFTGLTVAMNGHPTNIAKNEELQVSVNGVVQSPGAAYNAGGSTITFAQAPEADAVVFIVWFGPMNP